VLLRKVNITKTANCTKLPHLLEKAEFTLSKLYLNHKVISHVGTALRPYVAVFLYYVKH